MRNIRDLKIALTIGMSIMSLLTNTLSAFRRVTFGGGATMCFVLVVTIFLFEALYTKIVGTCEGIV